MLCIDDFGTCPLCEKPISIKIFLTPTSEYFQITCTCGLSFTGYDMEDLYSWDDRPELTCEDLAPVEDKFTCSECGYHCASAIDSAGIPNNMPWISYCPNCGAKVVDA